MSPCNGLPAEKNALAYIEGSLSEAESIRFEEHYFQCPVCLAQVQALDAACEELEQHPVQTPAATTKRAFRLNSRIQSLLSPQYAWGLLALSLILLVSIIVTIRSGYFNLPSQNATSVTPKAPTVQNGQAGKAEKLQATVSPGRIHSEQLADLILPGFTESTLRGKSLDINFADGMTAYSAGDCRKALVSLAKVPATQKQSPAAHLYSGACQMKLGNYAAANKELRVVVGAGDTPQLESALYELAQTLLAQDDPSAAHQFLRKTIALHGDLEAKAREEDGKVVELLNQNHNQDPTN